MDGYKIDGGRLVRESDGFIAVAISPGHGAGWSTWEDVDPFNPEIAEAFLRSPAAGVEMAKEVYPSVYHGGLEDVKLAWLPKGTHFAIEEDDGHESIRPLGDLRLVA